MIQGQTSLFDCGDNPTTAPSEESNITEFIKYIYTVYPEPLTPVEVRDRLVRQGFALTKYSNPLATIHSVLKRLAKQGYLVEGRKGDKPALQRPAISQSLDEIET